MNNLSLVNIFGETGRFFYNINYMLNSEHLSLVNKIGDKTEFTITRVHCILEREIREEVKSNIGKVHLLYAVVRAPRPHTRRSTSARCWFFHYFDKCLGPLERVPALHGFVGNYKSM